MPSTWPKSKFKPVSPPSAVNFHSTYFHVGDVDWSPWYRAVPVVEQRTEPVASDLIK